MVRGGVEPPTFRFSGITIPQVGGKAAAWTFAAERQWLPPVVAVAVNVAVRTAWAPGMPKPTGSRLNPRSGAAVTRQTILAYEPYDAPPPPSRVISARHIDPGD